MNIIYHIQQVLGPALLTARMQINIISGIYTLAKYRMFAECVHFLLIYRNRNEE